MSVLRAVAQELPQHNLVYFADQHNCPYGPRPPHEIIALSTRIVHFLITQNCRVIVVACNTASAGALSFLRDSFPDTYFIGMEPAVKPAARATRTGKIAVLATRGTLDGELFTHTREEFAQTVDVLTVYPQDWVSRVERGDIDSPETYESVRSIIIPLLDAGVDEIALGCTHYPFLAPLIETIAKGRATLLDPSTAVARQTARITHTLSLPISSLPSHSFYTSGDQTNFKHVLEKLLNIQNAQTFSIKESSNVD